jgi:putative nucleotidyltransferase with HDIG domain
MRFATRALLASFLPFAVLLGISFWAVRSAVIGTVRDGLRAAASEQQAALARDHDRNDARVQKLLQGIAENPSLKAGLQLLANEKAAPLAARATVDDQLTETAELLDFDLAAMADTNGRPVAGVRRTPLGFEPLLIAQLPTSDKGFFPIGAAIYQFSAVPISEADTEVATLLVGWRFNAAQYGAPAILLHQGNVVGTDTKFAAADIESALKRCAPREQCQTSIGGELYLSVPLQASSDRAYVVRTLQNVDRATAPLMNTLRQVFLSAGIVMLGVMLWISALSSRLIARPLATVAAHIHQGSATGNLTALPPPNTDIYEIQELAASFNEAAQAVQESRSRLTVAYVQFVGSLAQALDARDPYTAGHSRRVSEYSRAIAQAMGLPPAEIQRIQVGALLHDVGKIGISDTVLQKPSRLNADETDLIQQHPVIGKRILESVRGFEGYLDIVELHHENWDGTGYPHGLNASQTPLGARIVKVADAYDAMTSDRPYRKGMAHAEAVARLRAVTETQLDPAVVSAFTTLQLGDPGVGSEEATGSLQVLSESLRLDSRISLGSGSASQVESIAPPVVIAEDTP